MMDDRDKKITEEQKLNKKIMEEQLNQIEIEHLALSLPAKLIKETKSPYPPPRMKYYKIQDSWMDKGLKPEVRKVDDDDSYYILLIILLTILCWVFLLT